jgi:hypothetical protein
MANIETITTTNGLNILDKTKKKGSKFFKKLIGFIFLLGLLYIGIVYLLGAVFVFSDGERFGTIYKISKKGYVFKTHEGILKTGYANFGNTSIPNEEWSFSIANDSIAKVIENLDQRVMVRLHYKEHYTKLFWRGDTKYFVDRIEKMPAQ